MALSNQIASIVMALFIIGAIGGTAVTMASNSSNFGSGVNPAVVLVFTVAIPVMAGVAIMLYFLPRQAVALSPLLVAVGFGVKAKRWLSALLRKLGRC